VAEQAAAAVARVVKPPAAAKAPETFGLCEKCGEAVPPQQAKLSRLFQDKTLCKKCLESPGGSV
jgi:formylmethanofuran dehydrogenase subunit E